jgi:hypothetical protein
MKNLNWTSHLLFRAEGLAMNESAKKAAWSTGKGVPIGISPLGVAWYCYHDDGSESVMRANLDKLWSNVRGIK